MPRCLNRGRLGRKGDRAVQSGAFATKGRRRTRGGDLKTTTTTRNESLILALTCFAQFMVVLDIAIVNVALPSIQLDLGLRQSVLQWVVVAYGLFLGGFLLLGGRLGDLLGRHRIFLAGLAIFSVLAEASAMRGRPLSQPCGV